MQNNNAKDGEFQSEAYYAPLENALARLLPRRQAAQQQQPAQTSVPAPANTTAPARVPGHIIVFGNEKGGSGKSTSAMHTAVAPMRAGYQVATIDLDARQGTLTRYIRNRIRFAQEPGQTNVPLHRPIERSTADMESQKQAEEKRFLMEAITEFRNNSDFIIIDTPGTDSYLSRLAHIDAVNKRQMGDILQKVGNLLGFKTAPGFGERVIFRELFLKGLTLLDLREAQTEELTLSQVAARQEIRSLIATIEPEKIRPL